MKDKFLPIGTVVKLKGSDKNVMITSYLIFSNLNSNEKKMFDYGSCPFPEGIIESNYAIGFNHNEIEKIIHLGLEDEEHKKLNSVLIATGDKIKSEFTNFKYPEEKN